MAIEPIRGCGHRKVGGTYLCGSYISVPCDRLPYPLTVCPTCGAGIKVTRSFTRIIPAQLFGQHQDCQDRMHPCFMCDPQHEPAFILGVGERYYKTPADFQQEAVELGVSKRIPWVPKELEIGKTIVYLSHPKACEVTEHSVLQQAMAIVEKDEANQGRLLEADKIKKAPGIFTAFIPQKLEKLCWQSEYTDENVDKHRQRGIELVPVPDGDTDHA